MLVSGAAPVVGLLGILLIAVAIPLVAWVAAPPARSDDIVEARLRGRPASTAAATAPREPSVPRVLARPLERNLALAGLTEQWPVTTLVLVKIAGGALGLLLAILLVAATGHPFAVLLGIALIAGGFFGPDAVVAGRARERQDRLLEDLPDTLDQILIAIEAGLGLEAAVERAGRHGRGPLAAEFTRTVQDMRLGMSRREAYVALAERTTVADLRRFARAIMQADRYGVSVANVVRGQAMEMRARRRQRAEERAMRVPVLVLFPLMFCILPVLFIVVMAPAVINLADALLGISL